MWPRILSKQLLLGLWRCLEGHWLNPWPKIKFVLREHCVSGAQGPLVMRGTD